MVLPKYLIIFLYPRLMTFHCMAVQLMLSLHKAKQTSKFILGLYGRKTYLRRLWKEYYNSLYAIFYGQPNSNLWFGTHGMIVAMLFVHYIMRTMIIQGHDQTLVTGLQFTRPGCHVIYGEEATYFIVSTLMESRLILSTLMWVCFTV